MAHSLTTSLSMTQAQTHGHKGQISQAQHDIMLLDFLLGLKDILVRDLMAHSLTTSLSMTQAQTHGHKGQISQAQHDIMLLDFLLGLKDILVRDMMAYHTGTTSGSIPRHLSVPKMSDSLALTTPNPLFRLTFRPRQPTDQTKRVILRYSTMLLTTLSLPTARFQARAMGAQPGPTGKQALRPAALTRPTLPRSLAGVPREQSAPSASRQKTWQEISVSKFCFTMARLQEGWFRAGESLTLLILHGMKQKPASSATFSCSRKSSLTLRSGS